MAHDELQLGEEPAHLVDQLHLLVGHRHPRAGHAGGDEDRQVELDALGVQRVVAGVVDRHPVGERGGGHRTHTEVGDQAFEQPDGVHAAVGVELGAGDEAVGEVADGPAGRLPVVLGHVDHRPLDTVGIHVHQHDGHRVGLGIDLGRHVLKHVGRRHREALRLLIAQMRLNELVNLTTVWRGEPDHGVDDSDVRWHAHGPRVEHVAV